MFTILIVMMGMDIHKNQKLSNCTLQICHLLDSITDLAGYSPWGRKELDTTERLSTAQHITDSTDVNLSKLWERVKDRKAWHAAVHGVTKNQT